MNKTTSTSLGKYFDRFIEDQISEGRYKNADEVLRAGLRLLEEEETSRKVLKDAIREGEDSGLAEDFEPRNHLKALKKKRR